jgi:hypothetical protein
MNLQINKTKLIALEISHQIQKRIAIKNKYLQIKMKIRLKILKKILTKIKNLI